MPAASSTDRQSWRKGSRFKRMPRRADRLHCLDQRSGRRVDKCVIGLRLDSPAGRCRRSSPAGLRSHPAVTDRFSSGGPIVERCPNGLRSWQVSTVTGHGRSRGQGHGVGQSLVTGSLVTGSWSRGRGHAGSWSRGQSRHSHGVTRVTGSGHGVTGHGVTGHAVTGSQSRGHSHGVISHGVSHVVTGSRSHVVT
jgi:hypothetical protein